MSYSVTTPGAEPMTAEQVRTMHLFTLSFEDGYLDSLIKATREYLENAYDIAISTQTITEKLPDWTGRCLDLSVYPLQSVTSVKYLDEDDVEQTVSTSDYYVMASKLSGSVWFKKDYTLPTLSESPEAIIIEYVAGYATVPEHFIHAIRLIVARFHLKREDEVEETIAQVITKAEKLIFPNRAILI